MRNKIWAAGAAALVGVVVILGQPVLAQAGVGGAGATVGQPKGAGQLKKLADYLGLTPAQRAQIRPILKDQAAQVKAVRGGATLTPAQKKSQIAAIRKAHRQQVMALLTADQKTKLTQWQSRHKNS